MLRFSPCLRPLLCSLLGCVLASVAACGDPPVIDRPSQAPPAVEAVNSRPADRDSSRQRKRIKASNVAILRDNLGREVTVFGRVGRTATSRSGVQFLNFENSELAVVCFKSDVGKFREGAPAELYRNRDVEVDGTLELYKGKLQIKLVEPRQIRRIESADPAVPTAGRLRPVQLKQIGPTSWISPAGLRYSGHDPEGRTRVEHILRHAADIPERDGPHGVFDGGSGIAFAVIDEAWKRAEKKRLRPQLEGDRSSYLVSMGRRIGYLGGRVGKARRHPPLSRVLIVFETDTRKIITAFPK